MKQTEKIRVNVLYRGKERWRYPKTIKRAEMFRDEAIKAGLSSYISVKINGKYQPLSHPPAN